MAIADSSPESTTRRFCESALFFFVNARMAYTLLTAAITFTFFWGTDMGFVCRVGVDGWIQREMCFFCEWIFATDACMHAMSRFSSCYDTVIY